MPRPVTRCIRFSRSNLFATTACGCVSGRGKVPLLHRGRVILRPGWPIHAEQVGAQMERDFEDKGLADSATSLLLNEAFSIRCEHARYLTHHDLCALTAMQYEHAGFDAIWSILECALLSPGREALATLGDAVELHYREGRVTISGDARAVAYRQAHAILSAHGISVDAM